MARKSGFRSMALIAGFLTIIPQAIGQQLVSPGSPNAPIAVPDTRGGIRTDRLSHKQLRVWNSIREIVFAKDHANRLLHRRLHGLWQSAERSGHLIFVELDKCAEDSSTRAGDMVIDKVDPAGRQHVVSVRLFLSTINRAFAGKGLPEQFEPFAGLNRKARYAEVLGHELAHIERLFRDPNYLRLYMELDRELSSYCTRRNIRKGQDLDQEEQKRLGRIDILVNEMERPVVAAEAEIWRELVASEGRNRGVNTASHGVAIFTLAQMGGKENVNEDR